MILQVLPGMQKLQYKKVMMHDKFSWATPMHCSLNLLLLHDLGQILISGSRLDNPTWCDFNSDTA